MAIIAELKENYKEDRDELVNAISSLRKCMSDYKAERKSEWKLFKTKFNTDMEEIEKSLKKLRTLRKK